MTPKASLYAIDALRHASAELSSRYKSEKGLPILCLSTGENHRRLTEFMADQKRLHSR